MVHHSHRLKALGASHISPPVKQSNQGPLGEMFNVYSWSDGDFFLQKPLEFPWDLASNWDAKLLTIPSNVPEHFGSNAPSMCLGKLRPIVGSIASDVGNDHPDQFWQPGFRNP